MSIRKLFFIGRVCWFEKTFFYQVYVTANNKRLLEVPKNWFLGFDFFDRKFKGESSEIGNFFSKSVFHEVKRTKVTQKWKQKRKKLKITNCLCRENQLHFYSSVLWLKQNYMSILKIKFIFQIFFKCTLVKSYSNCTSAIMLSNCQVLRMLLEF